MSDNKLTMEMLTTTYSEWLRAGAKKGTNQRFGQYWWNQCGELTGLPSCPELFYAESASGAFAYIAEKFIYEH